MVDPFECVLIGQGTLPLACAEILHTRGNKIRAIISADVTLLRWAAARKIPHSTTLSELAGLIVGRSPDILFSIGNERLIPNDVLGLCRSAINYHDGPLPRYAGSHVTSWALMYREPTYAVTWHLMTRHTDAGDILRQTPVKISSDDTALTLNAKCYEAALSGFALLADDLANSRAQPYAQDLSRRTFFHRNQRPANGAVLDWNRCSEELSALVRALTFGSYPNPLGLPKILLGKEFLTLDALDVLNKPSARPPGTIVGIEPSRLVVATMSHDVALYQVRTLGGRLLSIAQLVARFHLQVGDLLPTVDQSVAVRLAKATETLSGHERFWVTRLATIHALGLPYSASTDLENAAAGYRSFAIPPELVTLMQARDNQPTDLLRTLLLHVFLAYLARISGQSTFDIGLRDDGLQPELDDLNSILATTVPLHIALDFSWTFGRFADTSRTELSLLRSHRTYPLDTVARHPELSIQGKSRGISPWLIVAQLGTPQQDCLPSASDKTTGAIAGHHSPSELTFQIAADGLSFGWIDHSGALKRKQIEQMSGQFLTFLKSCLTAPDLPLRALPLLPEEERCRLQAEWNEQAYA